MTTKNYADEIFKKFRSRAQDSAYYGGVNQTLVGISICALITY